MIKNFLIFVILALAVAIFLAWDHKPIKPPVESPARLQKSIKPEEKFIEPKIKSVEEPKPKELPKEKPALVSRGGEIVK